MRTEKVLSTGSNFDFFLLSPRFFFLKKNEGDIIIGSVRPLCYLVNHWMKCELHKLGVQQHTSSEALGKIKWSNIIKFQLQSQFRRFDIPNFVCVLTN